MFACLINYHFSLIKANWLTIESWWFITIVMKLISYWRLEMFNSCILLGRLCLFNRRFIVAGKIKWSIILIEREKILDFPSINRWALWIYGLMTMKFRIQIILFGKMLRLVLFCTNSRYMFWIIILIEWMALNKILGLFCNIYFWSRVSVE